MRMYECRLLLGRVLSPRINQDFVCLTKKILLEYLTVKKRFLDECNKMYKILLFMCVCVKLFLLQVYAIYRTQLYSK